MKISAIAAFLVVGMCAVSCQSSKPAAPTAAPAVNQTSTSVDGDPMLLGKVNRMGLTQGAFASWFDAEYSAYTVNTEALKTLPTKMKDIRVEIFMGTWCSDSQREVPRFYKIMDALQMDENAVTVIAVDDHPDRRKTSPQGEEKGKNIEYVPTFIFLRNGIELGRIVESPQSSLEADMASIFSK